MPAEEYPYHYPIYIIARLLDQVTDGAKKVEYEDDRYSIKIYKVNEFIRIDMVPIGKKGY